MNDPILRSLNMIMLKNRWSSMYLLFYDLRTNWHICKGNSKYWKTRSRDWISSIEWLKWKNRKP